MNDSAGIVTNDIVAGGLESASACEVWSGESGVKRYDTAACSRTSINPTAECAIT